MARTSGAGEHRPGENEASRERAKPNEGLSGAYLSNRAVWRAYRASPNRKALYMANRRELEAFSKARKTS